MSVTEIPGNDLNAFIYSYIAKHSLLKDTVDDGDEAFNGISESITNIYNQKIVGKVYKDFEDLYESLLGEIEIDKIQHLLIGWKEEILESSNSTDYLIKAIRSWNDSWDIDTQNDIIEFLKKYAAITRSETSKAATVTEIPTDKLSSFVDGYIEKHSLVKLCETDREKAREKICSTITDVFNNGVIGKTFKDEEEAREKITVSFPWRWNYMFSLTGWPEEARNKIDTDNLHNAIMSWKGDWESDGQNDIVEFLMNFAEITANNES